VRTTEDQTVAPGHSVAAEPARWQELFDQVMGRVAGRFARVELRRRARAFVGGLLSDLPRKNCWTIAEHAGDPNPDGMQHLLARAMWNHDGVRDDVRAYLVEHLGDPEAVLVVDETGDLKKGTATVGVQRQYTGTAGRIENAQVAVYLVYAGRAGHAVIDRELYLPRAGSMILTAGERPASPTRWGLRPSPSWPRPWSAARWTLGSRRRG
jgi:SRSO17 transposase